jgi:hypothetical protein
MPTTTYIPLANITLATATGSITFSSIPATYRDLVIIFQGSSASDTAARIRLNGDSGSTYSYQRLAGNGTSFSGVSGTNQTSARLSDLSLATSTRALQLDINILDYMATDKTKTIVNKANNSGNATELSVNRWTGTAAITSVQVFAASATTFSVGTTLALYGIEG